MHHVLTEPCFLLASSQWLAQAPETCVILKEICKIQLAAGQSKSLH